MRGRGVAADNDAMVRTGAGREAQSGEQLRGAHEQRGQ